jgi:hypothetical protein
MAGGYSACDELSRVDFGFSRLENTPIWPSYITTLTFPCLFVLRLAFRFIIVNKRSILMENN